jgi:hypothetical protein
MKICGSLYPTRFSFSLFIWISAYLLEDQSSFAFFMFFLLKTPLHSYDFFFDQESTREIILSNAMWSIWRRLYLTHDLCQQTLLLSECSVRYCRPFLMQKASSVWPTYSNICCPAYDISIVMFNFSTLCNASHFHVFFFLAIIWS